MKLRVRNCVSLVKKTLSSPGWGRAKKKGRAREKTRGTKARKGKAFLALVLPYFFSRLPSFFARLQPPRAWNRLVI